MAPLHPGLLPWGNLSWGRVSPLLGLLEGCRGRWAGTPRPSPLLQTWRGLPLLPSSLCRLQWPVPTHAQSLWPSVLGLPCRGSLGTVWAVCARLSWKESGHGTQLSWAWRPGLERED